MNTTYRPRIERALRYIAEHLAEPITTADIARIAHTSEFHFHRIFAAEVGEPVGRFVTRQRLELAALRLAYEPALSVTEIALASGYSSISNFTKAFTAWFGCPPTRLRDPGSDVPPAIGKLGKTFDPAALYTLPPETDERTLREHHAELSRQVRFVDAPGFDTACLASPEGYDLHALEETWAELVRRARELGIATDAVDAWGLAFDSPHVTAPERCRYHACVPCPLTVALPPPLFRGRIPAGRYAVFRYSGDVAGVEAMYRRIYSVWLPRSSVAPDDFVAVDHYIADAPVDGRVELEIHIKIRS